MAIVLLPGMSTSTSAPVESFKIHLGIFKALESLSTFPNNFASDQYLLMRAARRACDRASEVQVSSVEVPNLSSQRANLNASVKNLEEEDHQLCQREAHVASWYLDKAWSCRDFKRIVNILTDERNPNLIANHDNNYMAQALQCFLTTKQVYANRMFPEDRTALAFFQGIVKINQGKTEAGLADIETTVWGGYHLYGAPNQQLKLWWHSYPRNHQATILSRQSVKLARRNQSSKLKRHTCSSNY